MQATLFIIALICLGILVSCSTYTSQETTAEEKLRVQINATEDTITLRFIRPHANADTHAPQLQLEGYLLGYGGSMFSKQYIELPQDGMPYYAEMDAEPKYLISVEPVKPHVEKKKACPNKVDLKKPLHLVIGSITDTKVLLSWGTILNTPYTQQDADCPEDSQYTIRYREKDPNPESTPAPTAAPTTPSPPGRERQWNYQSCPSSTTVVDKLKPDTPYEFEVRTDTDPKGPSGEWSGPVVHNTNASVTETIVTLMENSNKEIEKPFKPPVVPIIPHAKETKPDVAVEGMQGVTLTKPAPKPRNGSSVLKPPPGPEKYNLNQVVEPEQKAEEKDKGPVDLKQVDPEPAPKPTPSPTTRTSTNRTPPTTPTPNKTTQTTPEPTSQLPRTTPRITLAPPTTHSPPPQPQSTTHSVQTPQPITSSAAPTQPTTRSTEPPKPAKRIPQPARPVYRNPGRHRPGKKIPEHPRPANGRTPRPRLTPPTTTTTTTLAPAPKTTPLANLNGGYIESTANSSVFSAVPTSEEDAMGNKRFIAPHVVYQTDKGPKEPCSITRTLSHFPDDEVTEVNVTAPPRNAPENVTVVAVEGCPSFVIIDWDKGDNETTEYEVTSSTKGPSGKEVSVLVTNKTHTAVENLNPESSYQFTVTPKNELGTGPSSEPVSFRTESVDPQVAEVTGKRAIWSTFPFKLDIQSECNGPQYIKRTWYRKFVGIQLCNSLRYKIYLSDSLRGPFYHIGDLSGHGEDHCQFVDSLLDGRTGSSIPANHLPETEGFYRAMRQEPVTFGTIGGNSHINYVSWYECGVSIPGKW